MAWPTVKLLFGSSMGEGFCIVEFEGEVCIILEFMSGSIFDEIRGIPDENMQNRIGFVDAVDIMDVMG